MKKANKRNIRNNAAQLLTGAACLGAVATTASAIFDTSKAIDRLDAYAETQNYTRKEIPRNVAIKTAFPCYIRTGILCGLTIASAIASNRISAIQIAEVTAALTYAYKHREKLISVIDTEFKDPEIRREIRCKTTPAQWLPLETTEKTGYGDHLCLETYSGRWFLSSKEEVEAGVERFKARYKDGEELNMNDFYKELHISETHFGTQYGWPAGLDEEWCEEELTIDIDILPNFLSGVDDHTMAGRPLLMIDFENEFSYPVELWHYY